MMCFKKQNYHYIDIDKLLKDYENEINPPPTCFEKLYHCFYNLFCKCKFGYS